VWSSICCSLYQHREWRRQPAFTGLSCAPATYVRLRKGSAGSSRGVVRFADELIARVARAGATGEKLLRADSAFWNKKLIARLQAAGWSYSISVRLQFWVPEAINRIPESAWRPLEDYSQDGEAQIAETTAHGRRLIVRRTRLIGAQAELWPDWRYFPCITNRTDPLKVVEAEHVSTPLLS
jgi:hypothetical protein